MISGRSHFSDRNQYTITRCSGVVKQGNVGRGYVVEMGNGYQTTGYQRAECMERLLLPRHMALGALDR